MSSVAQTHCSVPPGATAKQVLSFSGNDKLGPITLHFTPQASFDFNGKPKSIDPLIFTFEESNTGASWTSLGSTTTVAGVKTVNFIPTKKYFRVLGRGTNGVGGGCRVDVHYVGRIFLGQIDDKAFGGKDGYSVADDASPTAAKGNTAATASGSWPNPQGPPA